MPATFLRQIGSRSASGARVGRNSQDPHRATPSHPAKNVEARPSASSAQSATAPINVINGFAARLRTIANDAVGRSGGGNRDGT
jgi:hypothetical protein